MQHGGKSDFRAARQFDTKRRRADCRQFFDERGRISGRLGGFGRIGQGRGLAAIVIILIVTTQPVQRLAVLRLHKPARHLQGAVIGVTTRK